MIGGLYVCWALVAALTDARTQRIPNWLTLPAAIAALAAAPSEALWAGAAWSASYLLVACFLGGVGGGDVKFAFPLGAGLMAALPPQPYGALSVIAAIFAAQACSLAAMLALRRQRLPHGPAMVAGAFAVLLCGAM